MKMSNSAKLSQQRAVMTLETQFPKIIKAPVKSAMLVDSDTSWSSYATVEVYIQYISVLHITFLQCTHFE